MAVSTQNSKSDFRAGAASVVITPDEIMWLAGYAARKAPSQGKLTDLHARALAIQDASTSDAPLIVVSLDLIAVQECLVEPVAKMIREHYGVPRERMLFAASHTHYGPEVRADKVPFFEIPEEYAKKIPAYVESLRAKVVDVIGRAIGNLSPASLSFAQSTATFGRNRRAGSDEHDHSVPTLVVRDRAKQTLIAIVFGYACHNTTIDPQDRRWSGDWAGYAASQLEAQYPGAIALFITGAAGDQNPTPRGSVELSQKYGAEVAAAVETTITTKDAIEIVGPIRATSQHIQLAFDVPTSEEIDAEAASEDRVRARKGKFLLDQIATHGKLIDEYPLTIQAIDFAGKLLLIAIGGEIVIDWATQLTKTYGGDRAVWVAGYCNDMIGYVPTRRLQLEGGYEAGGAMKWSWLPGPFADDVEQRVVAGVRQVIETL